MVKALSPDICVAGTGSGGMALAVAAAEAGASVVVVGAGDFAADRRALDAVRAFCAAAAFAQSVRSGGMGIAAAQPDIDFKAIMRHVRSAASALAPDLAPARLTALGIRTIKAEPAFRDRRTLVAGDLAIRARHFVLAPAALAPDIAGLGDIPALTAASFQALGRRPGHLVVIGASPIGLALAQAFRRLGSTVTLAAPQTILGAEDPEMAAVVLRRLRAEGLSILQHADLATVQRRGKSGVKVGLQTPDGPLTVDATHLLLAGEHRADINGLALGKAGVDHEDGSIRTDAGRRTGNPRVHAIRDCLMQPDQVGADAARLAAKLLHPKRAMPDFAAARTSLTDPALASAGMRPAQAATLKGLRILRWPYAASSRAQAAGDTAGHVKLIVDAQQKILGAAIAGADAREQIGVWALAIAKGHGLRDMEAFAPPDGTFAEIGKHAASTYPAEQVRRPLIARLFGSRRLG